MLQYVTTSSPPSNFYLPPLLLSWIASSALGMRCASCESTAVSMFPTSCLVCLSKRPLMTWMLFIMVVWTIEPKKFPTLSLPQRVLLPVVLENLESDFAVTSKLSERLSQRFHRNVGGASRSLS